MKEKGLFKRFWAFLHEDSWLSFFVTLVLAFIIIKFVFFPTLSFLTGTSLPLVIVESCSMYHHEPGFENTFTSPIYASGGLDLTDTGNWIFQNGFSKGDIIFVVAPKNLEVGDVIIFQAGARNPLIHRVISINDGVYSTKGDNYRTNAGQLSSEVSIKQEQIIGKALFKVPFIGWAKLIFFEWGRPVSERGLC
jgi:signal peptidase I